MLIKIMKWVSSVVLLLVGLRLLTASCQVFLELIVCVSGLLVLTQAVRSSSYIWAAGFLTIAVIFNPVVPVLCRKTFLWLDWLCLMTFLVSLAALKRQPVFSIPIDN